MGESQTRQQITKAALKMSGKLGKACTDQLVGALGAYADTVAELVSTAGDTGCLVDVSAQETDALLMAAYGRVLSSTEADHQKCQAAIGRAGLKYTSSTLAAVQRCRNLVNQDKLLVDPATCRAESATAAAIAKAGVKTRVSIAKACTDGLVSSIGPCAATVDGLVTLTGSGGCMVTSHDEAVGTMVISEYGP